jgi:5-methylcytosine-specific restriction endonuclease McrA
MQQISTHRDNGNRDGRIGAKALQGHVASSRVTAKVVRQILEQQDFCCALSGRPLQPDTAALDHIVPISRGGRHEADNIQVLHKDVNVAKSSMTVEDFLAVCREVIDWADRNAK